MEKFRVGSDSRQYPRVPFKRGIKFKHYRGNLFSGELAQDLSEGGVRIRSNDFIPVGEQVALGIQMKDSSQVVEIRGIVVWVRYQPASEVYQLGVEFVKEAEISRSRISHFIDEAM